MAAKASSQDEKRASTSLSLSAEAADLKDSDVKADVDIEKGKAYQARNLSFASRIGRYVTFYAPGNIARARVIHGHVYPSTYPSYLSLRRDDERSRHLRRLKGLIIPLDPPPPKANLDDADPIPEATASLFSLVTFGWINGLMALGYARPLEATDLWKLQEYRSASVIAEKISASFDSRRKHADEYNAQLANGDVKPSFRQRAWWTLRGKRAEREKHWREVTGKKRPSLALAMNDAVLLWFWSSGVLKVIADTAQVTSPLVVKALINFATESYTNHREGLPVPGIGRGVGLAICLVILQLIGSLCTHHFFYRSASTGVLLRGGLIHAIYNRSLLLTTRARGKLPNGKLVNHISTDVSRIDFCSGFFHMFWAAPIQMAICLALLIINLGPSALAGFAFFIVATPLQAYIMKSLFMIRKKTMIWTDKRAKLLQELLGGMKVIKFFAWETPFLQRIAEYRVKEMGYVRALLMIRAANTALAMSTPTLASVIAFLVYAASGHSLNAAVIFSSLSLFQLLRMPLMLLPMSFSSIADARNAIMRLEEVFVAELMTEELVIDRDAKHAVEVKHGSFTWDAAPPDADQGKKDKRKSKNVKKPEPPTAPELVKEENIFKLRDVNMAVERGSLVAIVGAVGSGKTSLLQGMIGEMRRLEGSVKFGGTIGYCSQSPWIQNATIRENICFGRPFEHDRYWKAVHDACLDADLDMLPNGDMTEGISLSGGQKQRINICRAIYANTDIVIFDDPLSALDAHVGESVFKNVLADGSTGKTRILVTHALHFLRQVDYIYCIVDGRIVERGTYADLMAAHGAFALHIDQFVSKTEQEENQEEAVEETAEDAEKKEAARKKRQAAVKGAQLMQQEERSTGAVSWEVYKAYLSAGNGFAMVPLIVVSMVVMQAATVLSSYWLVWWQDRQASFYVGHFMGIYATLGVSQALSAFMNGVIFALLIYWASRALHRDAIYRVLHAPMSFFETTPIGRIMNRFSKDIDTMDNMLCDAFRMFLNTFSSIISAVILISILLPWFLIAVGAVSVLYVFAAAFYRASARELKRLDAILRSSLYSHFSESLSGLATIRAYGEQKRFAEDNKSRVDVENRAYWLTVTNQRWLGIRLDFFGILLTLAVAMLTVGTRFSISPAQTGVTLSYILSIQQAFGWMVRQFAEVENDMNSVERVVYYARHVEQEPPYELPEKTPAAPWPGVGQVEIKDIVLKYRPELPSVLKGLSMSVKGGEKIGIVGRTGAGKSSIMTALFRIVELVSGQIEIDGVDISKIGLVDLRKGLAIIPQDATLFSGTLRSNLDPFGLHDDARLWDALRRSYLVDDVPKKAVDGGEEVPTGASTPTGPRFTLDSPIEDEGANLSIGQRSLVSLARALVKDSKVLILDEATASVDYETDRKIQETIANEFHDRTILCIAHRLRTIISYDRICVLDQGQIAEYDTPANLFAADGIFRSMCERSGISLADIQRAAKLREIEDEHRDA
ncbi:ABC transporter [Vararia minispora EC-137]|uniref:ABC transporter n=1 Tax=Vararia minispora EC-137 TaxID=1314806 RepID=A0ACB8QUB3_9AGAM|nr:ABC transporter [Vararia minispora EC-137]